MNGFFQVFVLPMDPMHNESLVFSSDSLTTAVDMAIKYAEGGSRVIVRDQNGTCHYRISHPIN